MVPKSPLIIPDIVRELVVVIEPVLVIGKVYVPKPVNVTVPQLVSGLVRVRVLNVPPMLTVVAPV
jgi:hypothetical protein